MNAVQSMFAGLVVLLTAGNNPAWSQNDTSPLYHVEIEGRWFDEKTAELGDNVLGARKPEGGDFLLDKMLVQVRVDAPGLREPAKLRLVVINTGHLGEGVQETVFDASERLPRAIGPDYDYGYVAFWLGGIGCSYLRMRAELTVGNDVVAASDKDVRLECWD